MYEFTFILWDTTEVVIESTLLQWATDYAARQGIFLEDIDSVKIRVKKDE
tara:strand:+ start:10277 stop:10426 length:150 start_codon:yes stop_codon:yes gene_type:complete